MLIARKMQELDFDALMQVYQDAHSDDLYRYLCDDFFRMKDATYFVHIVKEQYVCAVRTEPYKDGLLLQALQTRRDMRSQGYAKRLILDVLSYYKDSNYTKIYSHVFKRNAASLAVHKSCGFYEICDHATLVDGTVTQNSVTMCANSNTRR